MSERAQGGIKTALVAALLLLQIVLGGLATNGAWEISAWCTAPTSSPWSLVFGLVHVALLGLLIFGLLSLRFVRWRLAYVSLLAACLLALPIQAILVWNGTLWCDAP